MNRDRAAAAMQLASLQLQKSATVTYEEARASSVQADLALEQAQQELQRIQVLAEAGAVSRAELEQARRNHM